MTIGLSHSYDASPRQSTPRARGTAFSPFKRESVAEGPQSLPPMLEGWTGVYLVHITLLSRHDGYIMKMYALACKEQPPAGRERQEETCMHPSGAWIGSRYLCLLLRRRLCGFCHRAGWRGPRTHGDRHRLVGPGVGTSLSGSLDDELGPPARQKEEGPAEGRFYFHFGVYVNMSVNVRTVTILI